MKNKDKIIFIGLVIFCLAFYKVRSILPPFIIAFVLAYFLHPLVDKLCKQRKISRINATLIILGSFSAIFVAICSAILPIIYSQASELVAALPQYFEVLVNEIYPKAASSLNNMGIKVTPNFAEALQTLDISSRLGAFFEGILNSSAAIINLFSFIFILPIIVFYLLKDWDVLVKKLNSYLSADTAEEMAKIRKETDRTLAGYIRGQALVCLIIGIMYAVLLSFTGLNFGFLIGLLTGFLSFIPYVGALTGTLVAIIVALFQWGFSFSDIIWVVLALVVVQVIESNFLTPKLVGDRIGLHPLWVIFGLFVFGSLFGFMGILFAMPLTAVCGVLVKHFSGKYKRS